MIYPVVFNKYNEIYEVQRFDNGFEQKSILGLNLNKKSSYKNLDYSIGVELIDWENYIFGVGHPESHLNNNIKKLSFNFSILYNLN